MYITTKFLILHAIFSLVCCAEPILLAGGLAGESTPWTGGSGGPAHVRRMIDDSGRLCYSSRCPLDIRPAQPGFRDRCEQPKGCSRPLSLHTETYAGSPAATGIV